MQEKKSNKKIIGIVIACVLAVALIITGIIVGPKIADHFTSNGKEVSCSWYKVESKSSSTGKFQTAVISSVDKMTANFQSYQNEAKKEKISLDDAKANFHFNIALSDACKNFLPGEVSSLSSLSGDLNAAIKGNNSYINLDLGCNDQPLASLNVLLDIQKKMGYLNVPELSDAYLSTSADFDVENPEVFDMLSNLTNSVDYDAMIPMLQSNIAAILDEIKDPELVSNIEVSANNCISRYNKLTAELTSEQIKTITITILSKLAENESFINFYNTLAELSSEDLPKFDDIIAELENKAITEGKVLSLSLYTDKKNEIKGFEIISPDGSSIAFLTATQDTTGFEVVYKTADGQTETPIYGSYKEENGVYSGTVTIETKDEYDSPINVTIDFDDVVCNMGHGFKGSLIINSPALEGVTLKLSLDATTANKISATIEIDMAGLTLLTVDLSGSVGPAGEIPTLPADAQLYDLETEIETYLTNSNFLEFLNNISTVTGIDINSLMNSF